MTSNAVPNPGSEKAVAKGCTCARMDNCYGRGAYSINGKVMFWISGDCPLHAKPRHPTDATQEPRT